MQTRFETDDVVVADVIATAARFGADPSGEQDSTAAIQSALDECAAAGGGTVWLPAGQYRVTSGIKIPAFVTLRGDWPVSYTHLDVYKRQQTGSCSRPRCRARR